MSRVAFTIRILQNYGSDKNCPFCDSKDTVLVERKKLLLQLRRCTACGLRFRWPKETPGFAEDYYQEDYEEVHMTTAPPDPETLKELVATNFAGSPKDFAEHIALLKEFVPSGRVCDFGCSWGYGVFQLQSAGYDAFGFEISRPRAEFGRRELGVEILDQLDDLPKIPSESVDAILTAHVLEHLLSLKDIFANFARILKPGGLLMIIVPNSGGKVARELGTKWATMINEKHTLALDAAFFRRNLAPYGFEVNACSAPYRDVKEIGATFRSHTPMESEGPELTVLAQRVGSGVRQEETETAPA